MAWCILPVVGQRQTAPDDGATRRVRCCMIEADPDTRSMLMIYHWIVCASNHNTFPALAKPYVVVFPNNQAVGSVCRTTHTQAAEMYGHSVTPKCRMAYFWAEMNDILYCAVDTCVMK